MKHVRTDGSHPHFQGLITALDRELSARYGPAQDELDGHNTVDPEARVVLAYLGEAPAGCGCFRPYDGSAVEIKRMFVQGPYRGLGIAGAILVELESWALASGFSRAVLETGLAQPEAQGLYLKHHYRRIANYGPYRNRPGSICLEKNLV